MTLENSLKLGDHLFQAKRKLSKALSPIYSFTQHLFVDACSVPSTVRSSRYTVVHTTFLVPLMELTVHNHM